MRKPSILSALLIAISLLPIAHADPAADPAPASLLAQPNEDPAAAWRFSGYGENDSRFLKPNNSTDRYYTNAVGFSLSLRNQFATDVTQWIPFAGDFTDQKRRAVGLTAAQFMFTPQDISETALITDDRPYAGYLYGGIFFQRSNQHTLDHIELDLGIIGPSSLAAKAQIEVHDLGDGIEPRGWDNQLADEPAVQLFLRKKWRTGIGEFKLNDIPPVQVQLIPQVELAVGTVYRHAQAGALFRIGFNLPDDFGPDRLADVGSFTGAAPKAKFSGYLFTRVAGKAVEHNLMLEGNTWKDSHGIDAKTLVGEIQVGIGIQVRTGFGAFDLVYSQTFCTEEFDGQDGSHGYGAITAAWTVHF